MKYIRKHPEPQEILDWKASDKMFQSGKANWNRLPTPLKKIIRESLKKEQGYICCYCERRLENDDYHNEHIRPQGIKAYEKYALDYDNLVCSCQFKQEKGEPRHCGNEKGSWYDEQSFISPLDQTCESKFGFSLDGHIFPQKQDDQAAATTITKLKLDIDKLNALRMAAIAPFIEDDLPPEDLEKFVLGYLVEKEDNGGYYNLFYTTIKYLFSQQ